MNARPPEDFVAAAKRIDGVVASASSARASPTVETANAPPAGAIDHPTFGQVVVAMKPQLAKARRCVVGPDPVHASLHFASSGTVDHVDVPAVDPTVALCVGQALSSVEVPPFTQRTYVVPILVRPLE